MGILDFIGRWREPDPKMFLIVDENDAPLAVSSSEKAVLLFESLSWGSTHPTTQKLLHKKKRKQQKQSRKSNRDK
jgi:hypothetical protein